MTVTATPVFDAAVAIESGNRLGEGILWDDRTELLHWVDIDRAEIHTYDPSTKRYAAQSYPESSYVTALAPRVHGEGLVASIESKIVLVNPPAPTVEASGPVEAVPAKSSATLAAPLAADAVQQKFVRFNDGACDAKGRFIVGSMTLPEARDGKNRGELFRVDVDGSTTKLLDDIGTSNGIDWSPDNKIMYYIDSDTRTVGKFDYDLATGDISNRQVFLTAPAGLDNPTGNGLFDGLVVDGVGNIWIARWGDNRVVIYSPEGTLLASIRTPGARSPTIPCFGGKDLTTLYIATASAELAGDGSKQEDWPLSGHVFSIDCGAGSELGAVLGAGWKGRVRHRFGG